MPASDGSRRRQSGQPSRRSPASAILLTAAPPPPAWALPLPLPVALAVPVIAEAHRPEVVLTATAAGTPASTAELVLPAGVARAVASVLQRLDRELRHLAINRRLTIRAGERRSNQRPPEAAFALAVLVTRFDGLHRYGWLDRLGSQRRLRGHGQYRLVAVVCCRSHSNDVWRIGHRWMRRCGSDGVFEDLVEQRGRLRLAS